MTVRSKIRNIALSQLVLSPTNVRKTPATAAEVRSKAPTTRSRPRLSKTRSAPRCFRPTNLSPWSH
jgi:hypothetical protein